MTRNRELLSFLGDDETKAFNFGEWFRGEREILKPALERRGFTNISFYMVESDSFGPLIRGCRAMGPNGKQMGFYYG